MNYKELDFNTLEFIGFQKEFSVVDGQNFKEIPLFWEEIMQSGRFGALLKNMKDFGVVGLSHSFNPDTMTFQYMIGVEYEQQEIVGCEIVSFQDVKLLEFEAKGPLPQSLQKVIQYVYNDFFKESEYVQVPGPEIEIYSPGESTSEDYISYYLVPVKRK